MLKKASDTRASLGKSRVSEPEFPLMATMSTGAWLAPGNRVEVMLRRGWSPILHECQHAPGLPAIERALAANAVA